MQRSRSSARNDPIESTLIDRSATFTQLEFHSQNRYFGSRLARRIAGRSPDVIMSRRKTRDWKPFPRHHR